MSVRQLPPDYREVYYFNVLDPQMVMKLNLWGLLLSVVALVVMALWVARVPPLVQASTMPDWPGWLGWTLIIGVLVLHEWVHGLTIQFTGHKPRHGVITASLTRFIRLPVALYATADGIYFPRRTFIIIALAPLVVISLLGMAAVLVVPASFVNYIAFATAVNAGGAIGDVWMTGVALRYPPSALVLDEADSIRIYVNNEKEWFPAPDDR